MIKGETEKNSIKKNSQPRLTRLTPYSRYEIGIKPWKQIGKNHKAQGLIT
jgi:hypothetical protein